jgi:hypothetical protein
VHCACILHCACIIFIARDRACDFGRLSVVEAGLRFDVLRRHVSAAPAAGENISINRGGRTECAETHGCLRYSIYDGVDGNFAGNKEDMSTVHPDPLPYRPPLSFTSSGNPIRGGS